MAIPEIAALAAANPAATTKLFASATTRIGRTLKGPAKTIAVKAIAALQGYGAYLEETHDRVATFKTFATPTQPVSVLDHFVTTQFEVPRSARIIDQDDLVTRIIRPSRIVLSAIAGYGKSMVMRYIALTLYENPRGRIPIFIELRHLNRMSSPDIIAYVHNTYKMVSSIQIEHLRQSMSAGVIVLLLDGFDELNHDIRPLVEAQILEISGLFPACSIVVSGRPNERFSAWRSFTLLKLLPMEKAAVVELINKLDYDKGVKARFITQIKKGLYDTHQSFLSTPLLAILMLLTYEQNASIPDKMHLFYEKAFETLFHKHDALKEQYNRSRKSGLQIDEFEKVFSVFCLKTYVLEKTEFTSSEITGFLREAILYEGMEAEADNLFFDVEEAVCLIMREGQSYFFVHRSFQEYFTAQFLSKCPESIRDDFISNISGRYWDNALPMLFDMASAQLEPTWIKTETDKFLEGVESLSDEAELRPLLARFSGLGFYIRDGEIDVARVLPGPFSQFLWVMRRFYPEIDEPSMSIPFEELHKVTTLLKKEIEISLPNGTETDFAGGIKIVNLPWSMLPEMFQYLPNLKRFAQLEFDSILRIRQRITDDQLAKHVFLKKLFPN